MRDNKTTKNIITTTTPHEIGATPLQLDLNGKLCATKIREQYKLSSNQMKIMQLLALNERAFSPIEIYKLCDLINQNSVHRFIQRGLKNKWVRQLEVIQGVQVNNMFAFYKEPDRLETGQIIKDHRYKYYEATKLGIRVFEINEKVSLL